MTDDALAQRFQAERPRLLRIAYATTGSWSEAEDCVQEAWIRLKRVDATTIDNLQAWLTTTVGRRTTEVGPRLSSFTTRFFDARAGAKFDITHSISLDVSGAYGESTNRQVQSNYVLISRLRTAVYTTSTTSCNLGASPLVANPNPLLPPLAGAGASPTAGGGCVPVNIFGADGSITPAMVPYLTASSETSQKTSLAQARALLTGDLGVSTPWASEPIGFAVGAEYRKYTAAQTADALSQTAGELGGAGGAVPNFSGRRVCTGIKYRRAATTRMSVAFVICDYERTGRNVQGRCICFARSCTLRR